MIRVAVVAQAIALRAGLRALLQAGEAVEVVAEAASLAELEPALFQIDVLVLASPYPTGLTGDLVELHEEVPTLLLLSEAGHLPQGPAGWTNAWGALPLDSTADELVAAVEALHQGLIVVSPPLAGIGLERLLGAQPSAVEALVEPLTERELEVLGWLAQGLANKQIAAALSISEHTVKFHVSAIYSKLGATNRTEAVRRGVQQGLVVL